MKKLALQQKEAGMRLATLAAAKEQEGNHKAALPLWQSSAGYPCNPTDSGWRNIRAEFCLRRTTPVVNAEVAA